MSNSIYQGTPAPKVKKAKFDLSHEVKLTFNMQELIPVYHEDVVPGDSFRAQSNLLLRFQPMLAPIMHLVVATMHFFFVPYRILCSEFEDWIYGGITGTSTAEVPYFQIREVAAEYNATEAGFNALLGEGSLWDYLGLPPLPYDANDGYYIDETTINAWAFLAYNRIWLEYYRDQTLENVEPMYGLKPIPGGNIALDFDKFAVLRKRAWEKDLFTSALPWPQRGPDVLIPLEGEVTYKDQTFFRRSDTEAALVGNDIQINLQASAPAGGMDVAISGGYVGDAFIDNIESVSNGTITINDFRTAVVLQRWYEAGARAGGRYIEGGLAHYGERVPDYRLDRPEYLGGGKQFVEISEVLATANSQDQDANVIPQGNMAGHGYSLGGSNQFEYRVREHGCIIGILSVMPKPAYQQGIDKKFLKLDRFDVLFPEFVGLGEQEVLSKELFYDVADSAVANDELFGYNQRYYEYKSRQDRVCADMRGNLSFWHLGRIFDERPVLDATFVSDGVSKRIFAVEDPDEDALIAQVYHKVSAIRPLPYYSVPGLLKI